MMITRLVRPFVHKLCQNKNLVTTRSRLLASSATTHEDVINFWFHEPKTLNEKVKLWFGGSPAEDKIIKDKFGDLIVQARTDKLTHWEDLSQGSSAGLAFILLLDQFCRSVYRGTADQFSHDHKALSVALKMIEDGKDKELSPLQRMFVYLPLEHNESLEMQLKCVETVRGLVYDAHDAESEEKGYINQALESAIEHHTVISKFGRFPKRNAVLGRESTPEELEIMQKWPYMW